MPRTKSKAEKKTRSIGVRLTAAQYAWLQERSRQQTEKVGYPIPMSLIAAKILVEAMSGN